MEYANGVDVIAPSFGSRLDAVRSVVRVLGFAVREHEQSVGEAAEFVGELKIVAGPPRREGELTKVGTSVCAGHRSDGVRVVSSHDGVHHRLLGTVRCAEEVPQRHRETFEYECPTMEPVARGLRGSPQPIGGSRRADRRA